MVHLTPLRIAFIAAALLGMDAPKAQSVIDETRGPNPNVSIILSTDTGKVAMTNMIPGPCVEAAAELARRFVQPGIQGHATAVGSCVYPRTDQKTDIICSWTQGGEPACKGS